MGRVPHGGATTTEAIRCAIQHSQARLRAYSKRCGINPKTVVKWHERTSVAEQRTGPKDLRSTVPSPEDEAVVVAFRRPTLLTLDDCLYALQATIPHLPRSSLHRCLQRHGISRLPEVDGEPGVWGALRAHCSNVVPTLARPPVSYTTTRDTTHGGALPVIHIPLCRTAGGI